MATLQFRTYQENHKPCTDLLISAAAAACLSVTVKVAQPCYGPAQGTTTQEWPKSASAQPMDLVHTLRPSAHATGPAPPPLNQFTLLRFAIYVLA